MSATTGSSVGSGNEVVPLEDVHAFFKKQMALPENKVCFDCSSKLPQWASVSHAIYICTNCAANHRSLGTHISFVRSPLLDTWRHNELKLMEVGGNLKCRDFLRKHGVSDATEQKYITRAAQLYRQKLKILASSGTTTKVIETPFGSVEPARSTTEEKHTGPTSTPTPTTTATSYTPAQSDPSTTAIKKITPAKKGLGGVKVDTDSFFKDFEVDEPTPTKAPTPAASLAAASVTTTTSKGSTMFQYNEPTVAALPDQMESVPYGLNKPASRPQYDTYGTQSTTRQPPSETAQKKFGAAAKSISSDQYFSEETSPAEEAEKERRLSKFSGAASISSSSYYERDESHMGPAVSAADMARNIIANTDFQAVATTVTDKAKQLGSLAQTWLNSYS